LSCALQAESSAEPRVEAERVDADERHGIAADVAQQAVRALLGAPGAERAELVRVAAALARQPQVPVPPASHRRFEHGGRDERRPREQPRRQLTEDRLQVRLVDPEHRGVRRDARRGQGPERAGRADEHVLRPTTLVAQGLDGGGERRALGHQDAERTRARAAQLGDARDGVGRLGGCHDG